MPEQPEAVPPGEAEVIVRFDKMPISPACGSVIPLKDGRLMWAWSAGSVNPIKPTCAILSDDEGRTWGDPQTLKHPDGTDLMGVHEVSLIRLASGALGLVQMYDLDPGACETDQRCATGFYRSEDEGRTWSPPVPINPPGTAAFVSGDHCLVLSDGRIIVPACAHFGPTPNPALGNPKSVPRFGANLGVCGPRCGMGHSFVYYSDDEGQSWTRSRNEAFVLLQRSVRGCYALVEPAVVELKDGRLLMIARTNLGRHYQACSNDRGRTWMEPEPTDLALLPSPCALRRIPATGDLLVIWSQSSRWEAMLGVYRHRLTCAVSKDEGGTWRHHRNLESLDDVARIEPDEPETLLLGPTRQPGDRKRYVRAPGPLRCNQPSCTFLDDKAIITYGVCVFGDKDVIREDFGIDFDRLMANLGLAPHERANKVRILPTEWFYA